MGTKRAKSPEFMQDALCLEAMICGNLSCSQPCDPEYPPAVCLLDPEHETMHTNGSCSWAHPGEAFYHGTKSAHS